MAIIRSMYKPREGNILTSVDFSALEVKVSGAVSGDKNLIASAIGGLDMHTELSKRLFFLNEGEVPKPLRSHVKTSATFRWLYGGTGTQTAEAMWRAVNSTRAMKIFGMDALGQLKRKGIDCYEKFEDHCNKVSKWFWEEMLPDLNIWRKETAAGYAKNGYLHYQNGFTRIGVSSRNALLNSISQGQGSFVTLNAVIGIFDELEQRGMETKVVCQVHDDIILDVVPSELDEVKKILYKHMIKKVKEYNPWLGDVPMEGVFGKAPINGSWAEVEDEGVLCE